MDSVNLAVTCPLGSSHGLELGPPQCLSVKVLAWELAWCLIPVTESWDLALQGAE